MERIAIIGMAGRFPGADNVDQLWENLKEGVESIRPFTESELLAAGVTAEQLSRPNYVNAGAVMQEPDQFDAAFFGFTPREAQLIDPQHRVLLECAWTALENAGYNPQGIDVPVGVFGGVAANTYFLQNVVTHPDLLAKIGHHASLVAREREYSITRIAYKLNLKGPAVSVNTACSTSGVAIHLACQSLREGNCDIALAGGARIHVPFAGYEYVEDGILSPDGHCRTFDAKAAGTVMGSGVAFVVLKRLEDALRDGDTIHAVILGSAVNNDGNAKVGYTAPSVEGQSAVIRQALESAEIDPETIGYVEAHGTATALGDPIEVAGLTKAYRTMTQETGYCAIGSIKSNLGHLDAAAGVAGVIKVALALRHRQLPPTLHYQSPNPQIDFENSPFYVADALQSWQSYGTPRRAAVSMFGLGGTNAHILLEEAPEIRPIAPTEQSQLLLFSAQTATALDKITRETADYLAQQSPNLAEVAWTLQIGRERFAHRRSVVCDPANAAQQLRESIERKTTAHYQRSGKKELVFLFAGGGAQYSGMAQQLYETEPIFRAAVDHCATLFHPHLAADIRDLLYPTGEEKPDLERPLYALSTLFTVQYALAQLWLSWGIRPNALIGHSMGEYTAACLAGVFSLESAVAIVALRGRLFEQLPSGGMLGVGLSESELTPMLNGHLSLAAINRPNSCVVSGAFADIVEFEAQLKSQSIRSQRLHIAVAAHSKLVEPILDQFRSYLETISFAPPNLPLLSNVSGNWAGDEVASADYWVRHLRQTVRFSDGINTLYQKPNLILLEVGAGQVVSTLARQHPAKQESHVVFASLRHPNETTADREFMLDTLGKLWQHGISADWRQLHPVQPQRIPLPTYRFERRRFWLERQTNDLPSAVLIENNHPIEIQEAKLELPMPALIPIVEAPPVVTHSRYEQIIGRILAIIETLSGYNLGENDLDATFLELGFDSLFLTQANTAFTQAFNVKITFRQLFEEAPTIASLARFIDQQLPSTSNVVATPPPPKSVAIPAPAPVVTASTNGSAPQPKDKGPWKPLNTKGMTTLTPLQKRALDLLIERINQRTPQSKALTEKNRPYLADPRTVAGFRRQWKELVYPIHVTHSDGSHVYDVDGNAFLDVVMGFGVAMFGHKPPFLMKAVEEQLQKGIEIGPQTPLAGEAAALVAELTGMERVAFCNTGSEAVLATMRIARTITGRPKIVTFVGDYHGIFDEVLIRRIGAAGREQVVPRAPGIPMHSGNDIILLDYGDPNALETIRQHAHEIAAVLVEPVQSRNPHLQPREFLHRLRELTAEQDIALIFDEMITGFRASQKGSQGFFGVQADIASYGKAVAGGMPIGIVAGKAKYMDALDGGAWQFGDDSVPEVGVTWFAGTFVRHPLSIAAVKAVMLHLKEYGGELQADLNGKTADFVARFNAFCVELNAPVRLESFCSWFLITFEGHQEFESVFYQYLRYYGIHITEGRPAFLSTAHSSADIEQLQHAFRRSAAAMIVGGFFDGNLPIAQKTYPDLHELIGADAQWRLSLPLTDGQLEIWLSCQANPEANRAYTLSNVVALHGSADVDRLRVGIETLVNRHEALRTTISADGRTQLIAPTLKIDVPIIDLTALSPAQRTAKLAQMRLDDVNKPFELTRSLFRAQIIRLTADETEVWLTGHHIIIDGWSSGVLMRELGEWYAGQLPPATMQLSEFVAWQSEQKKLSGYHSAECYWLDQFATPAPYLELPYDHPRPAIKSYSAHREELELHGDWLKQLRQVGAKGGTTLFTTLLAAYQAFLYQLNGSAETVIGVAAAIQSLTKGERLVGHGANLLPLRTTIDPQSSFNELLKTERTVVLNAFEHQIHSFGELVQKLTLPRDPSRVPLVAMAFNLDPTMGELPYGQSLKAIPRSNPRAYEKFDLFFNAVVLEEGLRLECTYNRDLFEPATIQRWLTMYESVLHQVAANPNQKVAELSLLSAESRQRILHDWNNSFQPHPTGLLIHQLLEAQAERTPDAAAWVYEGRQLSYQQLNRQANQLARQLQTLGVGVESRVGLLMDRSLEMGIAVFGVLKAGGCYIPLEPDYPTERIRFIMEDSDAAVLITQTHHLSELAGVDRPIVVIDTVQTELATYPDENILCAANEENLAYIIYTSGSTGRPKGAMLPHRAIVNFCFWYNRHYGLNETDAMILKAPFGFDASVWEIFTSLANGGRVVVAKQDANRDPDYLIDLIERERVTSAFFVPTQLQMLIDHPRFAECHSLKLICCGGEAFRESLREAFNRVLPTVRFDNFYGPTETCIGVLTWNSADNTADHPITPIGRPNDNCQLYLLNEALEPVPVGVQGELLIGGRQLARGYWNRPKLTAERFIDNPFGAGKLYRTGDYVKWREDGAIEYIGRIDHQIKLRGLRIELGEIEAGLLAHPTVEQAVVIVREDQPNDKRIVAYLVGKKVADSAELRSHLKKFVPSYMIPAAFVTLPAIPISPNGKIDRRALPEPSVTPTVVTVSDAPRTILEQQLLSLWRAELQTNEIGIHDDFFELGGHSLSGVRLLATIEERIGRKLTLSTLLQAPTIAQLASLLEDKGWQPTWTSLVPIKPTGSKRPFFYVNAYMESVLNFNKLGKHFDPDRPFYGLQPQGLDGDRPIHSSVPEMAQHYLNEIRTIQPTGPYLLGGHCAGAWVAYEMAQMLTRRGEEVAYLAIVDVPPPHVFRPKKNRLVAATERINYYFGEKRLWNALIWQYQTKIESKYTYTFGSAQTQRIAAVQKAHEAAHESYRTTVQPMTYAGDLHFFRCSEYANFREKAWHLRWSELTTGKMHVLVTPSTHATMLHEPQVRTLAEQIGRTIDTAEA